MFDDIIDNIEDLTDDVGKKFKKLDKKKVFTIMCIGVGGVALLMWYRGRNTRTEYSETIVAGTGGGAGDIPYTGSASGSGADAGFNELIDEFNGILEDNALEYEQNMSDLNDLHASQMAGVKSEYDQKLKEQETYYIDQIAMFNEDAEKLKAENDALSKSLGSYDNSINYTAEIKQAMADGASGSSDKVSGLVIARATKIANEESKSQYRTDYDPNVDYMSAINKAKADGASQEVIDTLTAQREAKIKGEKMTQYYGDLKKE